MLQYSLDVEAGGKRATVSLLLGASRCTGRYRTPRFIEGRPFRGYYDSADQETRCFPTGAIFLCPSSDVITVTEGRHASRSRMFADQSIRFSNKDKNGTS